MYIKKATKKEPGTGKIYYAYHLVESTRTEKGPRQNVLLYLGSELSIPEGEYKLLAERIENILNGESSLIPPADNIERLAQQYASQLIHRLSENMPEDSGEKAPEDFVNVNINSLETIQPRSIGAEHLVWQIANQLKLSQKLQELGFSETEISIALGSIIARAVHPKSERNTYYWLCEKSGLGELLDFEFKKSSLDKLYQISDRLLTCKEALENYLEEKEKALHGYQSTIVLYDLTNTYMEGQAHGNPKALYGRSKEKRSDCPLITMGLSMNEHGFLNRTSILPGNVSEPKTLEEMIKSLDTHETLFRPIIILDAGIASELNLQWLRDHQYPYVVSAKQKAPSMELEAELVPVGDLQNLVKAALIKSDSGEEKWLYCESEAKAAVAEKMKLSFKTRMEEDLKNLASSLTKNRGQKKYKKVLERLGRLKEKHKRISGCYEVRVIASEDGTIAKSIEWNIIEEKMTEKLTGKYFLRTNLTHMGPKELWQLYNTLRGVEDAFRFMKSSLGMRPIYHQKEHRVDGHLWITILAYHLLQNCLYQLNKEGINYHWESLLGIMANRMRVTTQAKIEGEKILYYRHTSKVEDEQKKIYRALGWSTQILKAKKTII